MNKNWFNLWLTIIKFDEQKKNVQFQLKNKPKNEPMPTVKIEQINEETPTITTTTTEEAATADVKTSTDENIEAITAPDTNKSIAKSDAKNSRPLLRPSPSETSLSRSRSLEFPALPKHSPDCKDNPYKLWGDFK